MGCKAVEDPYLLVCDQYNDSMLSHITKKIYDTKTPNNYLRSFVRMIANELCQANVDLTIIKNDIYLSVEVIDEPVLKGAMHGIDAFANYAVAEIIRIGNTPGASDYLENVDFTRHQLGVEWKVDEGNYGYGWGYPYGGGYYPYSSTYAYGYGYLNPYYPQGRQEPAECDTYYVSYRYGVRDERLYEIFGSLVKLQKYDFQTYPEYRRAIQALILCFLRGPTVDNIKDALSVFHPIANIDIIEFITSGWVLNESALFNFDKSQPVDIDTGTVLTSPTSGFFEWSVTFTDSYLLDANERKVIEKIIDLIKPAHTKVYIFYQ